MHRRQFLVSGGVLAAFAALAALVGVRPSALAASKLVPGGKSLEDIRGHWQALVASGADVSTSTAPLVRTNEEWRKALPAGSYNVLREEGTERPFSTPLNDEKHAGVFVCAGCALPLFTSEMKFDSGTGWPSFFTSIPDHLATKVDYKLIAPRTEYHCVRCGGHQGHIFDDGPAPTHQRWCNNGVALRYIPTSARG